MPQATFTVNPELSAIAMVYSNPAVALIADQVLPRRITAETFKYTKYDKSLAYTVPDTRVGRKSAPNLVEFEGSEETASCVDFGLDSPVPNRDMKVFNDMPKAGGAKSPLEVATMFTTQLVQLDREIRVAKLVFNAGTYVTGQKEKLTGQDQFSDFDNSDPLGYVMEKLDVPLIRPNVIVIGQEVWTKLRTHPAIVNACKGTAQNAGVVARQQVAELFEVSQILVGAGRMNTARKGQLPNFQRCWGKHMAMLYIDGLAAQADQPCFGFTGQWGDKVAGTITDPDMGLDGGIRVRVGERVVEVISAADCGFFVEDAVA